MENQFVSNFPGNISLYIKRDDLLHPEIPGNKFRKLKYNLVEAKSLGYDTILTFGGAYSNHIAATAAAGKLNHFKTIGIIRGEELARNFHDNATLHTAVADGMQLHFISREEYRKRHLPEFIDTVINRFGPLYVLPEGGTNALAVSGCEEILTEADFEFDYICCAVGTGGTLAGIINKSSPHQTVLGFPALIDENLENLITRWSAKTRWRLIRGYEFGGYAKSDAGLINFINDFLHRYKIPLDPVYTGKMLFGVMDMVAKGHFEKGTKILAIHTGGLQGIAGMNEVLLKKGLPIIHI